MDDDLGSYFYGYYVELPGCESKADTLDQLISNMGDAKLGWISIRFNRGEAIPQPQSAYSGQLMLELPRSLHQQLDLKARQEGITLNQYLIYKLSQ